ncbi:MAG: LysR family transcriptional regulator [Bacilli bacterium]|nr:LysR family transcriptional regulator [Bacilli bacterium]
MNINFELYKVFYEVANQKSISKGAEKLMISQPAVTQSIKTLESELGTVLFIRTPKGVTLTSEGKMIYDYIKEGMNYFINGARKLESLKKLEEGTLLIGSTSTISSTYLMPFLSEFHQKYPNIDIHITNDLTENLMTSLRNGSLDIIITAIPSSEIKDMDYTKLETLHDIFVGSKKYQNKKYLNYEELFKEDILLPKSPSLTRTHFNTFLKEHNLKCTPKMEVVSHLLRRNLAQNDFGIALLTREFIKEELGKSLFEINVPIILPTRPLGYALKKNQIPSYAALKLIEIIESKNEK